MIHRTFSDLPRFKEMSFHNGLNLVLADKTPGATERQTRNGAGKSSLVELFHFLMGAKCDKDSLFRNAELIDATFGLEFDLGGDRVTVTRSGKSPGKISVIDGATKHWPVQPKRDRKTGKLVISNTNWKLVLGRLMFHLPDDKEGTRGKFGPPFRSVFSYFARRQASGGFVSPVQHFGKQLLWDEQVSLSFLLGLDWTIPQEWQVIREREKGLEALRKASRQGALGELLGSAAELGAQLTLAEEKHRKTMENVSSFRVLPEYRDLEREVSALTRKLNDLANENALDRLLLAELERAMKAVEPPPMGDIERLYAEVGVALPDVAIRRFEEVRVFHDSVVANRRTYLQQEQEEAQARIAARDREKEGCDYRRSVALNLIRTHGALEQFTLLQAEANRLGLLAEGLREQLRIAKALESGKTELDLERVRLLTRLRQDYEEQNEQINSSVRAFGKVSELLYESPGILTVSPEQNGPRFGVKIHAGKSKGINNMQIFCFDLMLSCLCSQRGIGPGFLIHDSHLFDGVDERQVERALLIGAAMSARLRSQYIVTMNSDVVPSRFLYPKRIVKPRLTDATDTGGLFGIRFE
jgi:uncharacterized protein YydD (DUF2326 family)